MINEELKTTAETLKENLPSFLKEAIASLEEEEAAFTKMLLELHQVGLFFDADTAQYYLDALLACKDKAIRFALLTAFAKKGAFNDKKTAVLYFDFVLTVKDYHAFRTQDESMINTFLHMHTYPSLKNFSLAITLDALKLSPNLSDTLHMFLLIPDGFQLTEIILRALAVHKRPCRVLDFLNMNHTKLDVNQTQLLLILNHPMPESALEAFLFLNRAYQGADKEKTLNDTLSHLFPWRMAIAYLIQESLPNISTQHPLFSLQSERLPDLAFLKFKGGSDAYVKAVETLLGEQVQQISHPYEKVISKAEGSEYRELAFEKYYEDFSDDEKCLCAQLVVTQMALYDFVKNELTLNDIFIHKIALETTVLDDKDTLCDFSFKLNFPEYKEAIASVEFNDNNIKRLLSSTDPKSIALIINMTDDSLPTLGLPTDIKKSTAVTYGDKNLRAMFFGSETTDRNVPTAGISNTA